MYPQKSHDMFISFTGPRVELDPERYPEGLVVSIRSQDGNFEVTCEEFILNPKVQYSRKTGNQTHSLLTYSLTEGEEVTQLDDQGYADFRVPSHYTPVDGADGVRNIGVSLIRRPEGWMVELTDNLREMEDSDTFSYPLGPRFNPLATITLEGPKPKEVPEEKPPGETIWERLDED